MFNFNSGQMSIDEDYELLINSNTGLVFRHLNNMNFKEVESFDSGIRSLFLDSGNMEIVIKDDFLYINTNDENKDSYSIKLAYKLPANSSLKYIYFDKEMTYNINFKHIRKVNIIEKRILTNIFLYNKRLQLPEDVFYVEEYQNGDFCPKINNYRKSIIEYKCDLSGNNDLIVSIKY